MSTFHARLTLRKHEPLSLLVDNTVLGHGITHETAWISTGTKKWGHVDVPCGYMARIPVHAPTNDGRVYLQVKYLAGIAHLARSGLLELRTSAELDAERFRQPIGRFQGYGYGDYNVFKGVRMKSVDDDLRLDLTNPNKAQLRRVASCTDPLYQALLQCLGEKSSLDAYHIYTAEKCGLYGFLHIDFALAEKVKQHATRPPFPKLRTQILMPSELAKMIHLLPVDTNLLTLAEDDQFFPTRADLHWENQLRQRPRKSA
jgi:hypothetical protein